MHRSAATLSAFEVMWNNFYTMVTTEPRRISHRCRKRIRTTCSSRRWAAIRKKTTRRIESALGQAYEEGLIADAVIAQVRSAAAADLGDARRRWPDDAPRATFVFDVSMRISKMEAYVEEVNKRLAAHYQRRAQTSPFGHMGDGNLHFVISVG
jgi:FAD/FMN-containing dehydrogenase